MSWRTQDSYKTSDFSVYQNPDRIPYTDHPETGRIDYDDMLERSPEIYAVISRIAGSWSGVDPDFQHNFSESGRVGYKNAGYMNINPAKNISELVEWWKTSIGTLKPKLLVLDCETDAGKSASTITTHIKNCLTAIEDTWLVRPIIYTAAWWWDNKVLHGWEDVYDVWVAHYPYFVQDYNTGKWRVCYSFDEVPSVIDNAFTPRVPLGWDIEDVAGWQFTDKIRVAVAPKHGAGTDGSYFQKWFMKKVFDGDDPIIPPSIDPVELLLQYEAGKINVTEQEV